MAPQNPWWIAQEISIPAADIAAAAATPGLEDDLQVLAAALAGPDSILGRDLED